MNPNIKLILTIVITLLIMFATTLLLDLQIIQQQPIRQYIIYLTIAMQLFFGYMLVKYQLK